MVEPEAVQRAHGRISGIVHETPVMGSASLDARAGGRLLLKMESFQRSGSFKFRGAFHAVSRRLDQARAAGVVTGSSGNHGGALALAARTLGVRATVVMPEDAAAVKVAAVQDFGARVVRWGLSSDERLARARQIADEEGMVFVPPYDDEDVMAGQGTVAREVLEQVPDLEVFIAPCGGGGLLAGCALWLAAAAPDVEVWGVEASDADDTRQSFERGERVRIPLPRTIADGIRNVIPGALTFPVMRDRCRGIAAVDDREIVQALHTLLFRVKVVAEPTGAVAAAAALSGRIPLEGRRAVAVVSGGNLDPVVLRQCLEETP